MSTFHGNPHAERGDLVMGVAAPAAYEYLIPWIIAVLTT